MPFKHLPIKTTTIMFRLVHVSKLFVFKRNFYNHCEMVQIVAELLRVRSFEHLQLGENDQQAINYESFLETCEDCAIIRINIIGEERSCSSINVLCKRFLSQLENESNIFSVDAQVVCELKNNSAVDIVISPTNFLDDNDQTQAA